MSRIGEAIVEMEEMGIEPTQENLGYYIKQQKLKKKKPTIPTEDGLYQEKGKEKNKK